MRDLAPKQDMALKQDILDELEFDPSFDASDIGVGVEDGIVTLSGHVASYAQKSAVERAVGRVKGVRGIAVELEVRFPGTTSFADDEIARRVLDVLSWRSDVPTDKVQVKVQKGWVTLNGRLDWNYQKVAAGDAVRTLEGVKGLSNLIEIGARVSNVDVKRHIEEALKRDAEVEAHGIRISVEGDKVILEGNVKAWHERAAAERAAWATPGVTIVEDRLIVA